jgi:hypothetical protein
MHEVQSQTGKMINSLVSRVLLEDAEYLVGHCH